MSWQTTVEAQRYPPTFTERTGRTYTCYAPHRFTHQIVPVVGTNGRAAGFWGYATYNNTGWPVIIFDVSQLSRLPDIVIRFTYYHECAHLRLQTRNEIKANCAALQEMRKNGDLSKRGEEIVEEVTRSLGPLGPQYGGSGQAFWDATLRCAGR